MATISMVHIFYLIGVIAILATMIMRKDTLLPCIIFIFIIGFIISGNMIGAVQALFNSILYAGTKFMDIIVTISIVSALSKCLSELGSDYLIMSPGFKIMRTPKIAFWVIGLTMFIFSLFLWPSPAVALIGAIMLPVALKSGLKPLGAAMAMNMFGHGFALSYDFIIQGAPAVTAQSAGISASDILSNGHILFITMGIVTTLTAFFMYKDKLMKTPETTDTVTTLLKQDFSKTAKFIAILVPMAFVLDIIVLLVFKLKGGDATSLVSGTALILMCIGTVFEFKKDSLEKITDYIKYGFSFGIKIFAPVIIIGAFFFMGGEGIITIFPEFTGSTGIMNDLAMWLSTTVPLQKHAVAFLQMVIGGITGLDGSGFSGLPLVGSLARTFGNAISCDISVLAALGQITAIWVGGGVIIPWGLIPVAAICGVDPNEMARVNFKPVMVGFLATLIVAFFIL